MANNGKSYSVQKELDKKYGVKSSSGRASGNTSVQDTLDQKYSYENSNQRRTSVQDWSRRYREVVRAYGETGGTLTDESGNFRNRANTLIQDYDKIKGYSGRMGLPNGQDYIRALRGMVDATGKNRQRAATASGLLPEDLAGLQQKRAEYQKQLDGLARNPTPYAARENISTPEGYAAALQNNKGLPEVDRQIQDLQGKIGDIDTVLTIYNRIDKFGDDVTAKYAGGNSMEAREAWRNGKDEREQTFREKERELRQDSTPYAARESAASGDAYAAALSNPQDSGFTARRDAYKTEDDKRIIDRLDEYLTWFDGLSEESQRRIKSSDVNGQNPYRDFEITQNDPGYQNKHWGQMTEDERNAVFQIANTEGTYAAAKYLEDLQMTLDRRQTLAMEQNEKDRAEKTPLIGDMLRGVATVPGNLIGAPVSFIGNVIDKAQGKGFNPYSNANFLLNQSGAVREASSQEVYKAIAGDGSNEFMNLMGQAASNAYQAGLSALDSLAGMATMGKFYTVSMGMGAASQRMRELVESGASDKEIMTGAILSGIAEAFFEYVSLDKFGDQWIEANPAKFIRKALIQAGVEGSEEVFTELANQLIDSINRGVNSDHERRIRALMGDKDNPMSREEAARQAMFEDTMDVIWAGLGGAFSGGLMSVGGLAYDLPRAYEGGVRIAENGSPSEVVNTALELHEDNKTAQRLQERLNGTGKGEFGSRKSDYRQLYRVSLQNAAEMTGKDVSAVRGGIEERLTELNVPNGGKTVASAIVNRLTGKSLSVSERLALAKNQEAAQTVLNEIYSVAEGGATGENAWVRKIGTFKLAPGTFGKAETQTEKAARESMDASLKENFGDKASAIATLYDEGQNRDKFTQEMLTVYHAGQDGRDLASVPEGVTNQSQRLTAYVMGAESVNSMESFSYEDGQSRLKSDGTPVNVVGFASTGRNAAVALDDGGTAKASDVVFATLGEARLYKVVADMGIGTEAANGLLKAARESRMNESTFAVSLYEAYQQGASGVAFDAIPSSSESMRLGESARRTAWEAGRKAALEADAKKQAKMDSGRHGKKSGSLTVEESAKAIGKRSAQQESAMHAAELLSRMGLDITVFASTKEEQAAGMENGSISLADGSIRVDLNAGADGQGVMAYALSHEFTHFVEEMSPQKFRAFTDILFAEMGKSQVDVKSLIDGKMAVLKAQNEGLSESELRSLAYSEAVAEMMEPVLTDTDAISRISQKIKQQDRSLWGKIKDFIKGIVEKLKAAYRDMEPDSAIARLTRETVTNSEAVLDAFSEAAADAVVNYNLQEGQKNNAREGVQFSQREYDSISKQFTDEIRQWVKDGQDGDRQFILGSTGEVLQGLGAIESDIYMNSDKINTILKEHPEITLEEIQQIPKIINDPILVMKSRNAGRSAQNTRMTMFGSVKGQNGLPVMVVFDLRPSENHFVISDMQKVTSAYTKTTNATSFVENSLILYADKKRTTSLLRSIGFHMPIELLQSGYVGSISYNQRSVNLYGEKFSDVFRKGTVLKSSRDSAGNALTEAQQRYFADSQVRDEDGNLIPVYHRTDGDFTVFQRGKLGGATLSNAADAGLAATSLVGHWFSDHDLGDLIGKNVVQSYLNIQNPYETGLLSLVQEISGFSSNPEMMQEHFENGQYNMVRKAAAEFTAWLRSEGYDGLKVIDQENGGVSYVVLDSRQAKLTTNQNPTRARDIRYSSRTASDSEYLNLAQNPEKNREALSRMVENAAREAGYDSPMLYHGTQSFGFTNFDLDKMDDKRSIFLTSNPDIAATYSGVDGSRNIGKASGTDINTLSLQEVAQMMNQFPPESGMDYQYSVVESKAEISGQVDRGLNELNNLINTLKKQYGKDSKEYGRLEKLQNTLYLGTNDGLSTQLWMILKQTDLFKGHEDFVNGLEQNLRLLKKAPDSGSFLVEKALGGYSIDVLSEADAKEELAQNMQRGNYALYARLGNTLTVEGEGQRWNNLKNWARGMEVDENSTYVMEDDGKFFLLRKADDSVVENGVIEATEKARELSPDALQFLLIQKANTSLRILTEAATTTRDVTKWAKNAGYDSVIFKNIKDSGGQNNSVSMDTTADIYVIFNPNNAKSADAVTYDDNGNVIPLSQRFDTGKEDIRYSARNPQAQVEAENERLKTELEYLKKLVQIQKRGNKDFTLDRNSVKRQALELMRGNNATGKSSELTEILDGVYRYIGTDTELTWEGFAEKADAAADWILEHQRFQRDAYAQEVLNWMGKQRFRLNEAQVEEAKYRFGSLNEFQKQIRGTFVLDQSSKTGLDQLWQEAAEMYPDQFSADTTAPDMPGALANLVQSLQGMEDTEAAYRKSDTDVRGELIQQIYDRYWNVEPVKSVSDKAAKQIDRLKAEHREAIRELKEENRDVKKELNNALREYRRQRDEEFKTMKAEYKSQLRQVEQAYRRQTSQLEGVTDKVERDKRTELRGKTFRAMNAINRMLLNPGKTLYVPDSLQPAVIRFMQGLTGEIQKSPKGTLELRGNLESLQAAYANLANLNKGVISPEIHEGVAAMLSDAMDAIGNMEFKNLNREQLTEVYNAVKSVLHTIRNANKMYAENLRGTYGELADLTYREFSMQESREKVTGAFREQADTLSWNMEKPVYAAMRLGSDTMLRLYQNLRSGEDTWARDFREARAYAVGTMAKYNYDKFTDKIVTLTDRNGKKVGLNLEERMSLYACARREQAVQHLTKGGFVLSSRETRSVKNRLGIRLEQRVSDFNTYVLGEGQAEAIRGKDNILELTDGQKAFADAMQDYLSTVCGEKNNEISRELYGVSLAKEKNYWPIRSSGMFSEIIRNRQENPGNRQKNAGHMKATNAYARNAIELSGFMDTWASAVDATNMYHAFTLPMEDFMKVWNWKDTERNVSMRQIVLEKHGNAAVQYFDTFMKDLNKGVRTDPRAGAMNRMLGNFKKGAVSFSLSVAIQQPSAVGRAFAFIHPKYFTGSRVESVKGIQETWEIMQKYAPVVTLKDVGRFDMDMGMSTTDILTGKAEKGVTGFIDKIGGVMPEFMDKITWIAMWEAAKRQVKAENHSLSGDALLRKAGELFTKTVTETQVYDSVFSRNGLMRSQDVMAKAATAFMAEPATTANMVMKAMRDAKNKNFRAAGRTLASVGAATLLNAILASLVYASRDDDEDMPWIERYLKSFVGEMVDGINPLGYIPVVKDLWSIFQGYDVIRSDVSQWADLYKATTKFVNAWEKYGSTDKEDAEARREALKASGKASADMTAAILNLFGIPLRNVLREIRAIGNVAKEIAEPREGDRHTRGYALWNGLNDYMPTIFRADTSKKRELYRAVTSGSAAWVDRMKAGYDTVDKFNTAVVNALRENDRRVLEAAKASASGDEDARDRLVEEIAGEGKFTKEQVEEAVEKQIKKLPGAKYDALLDAVRNGGDVQGEMDALGKYGYSKDQMENKIQSSVKEWYQDGIVSKQDAQKMLDAYAGETSRGAESLVKKWSSKVTVGIEFSEISDEYLAGNMTASRAVEMYMLYGGYTREDAEELVRQWGAEKDLGIKYSALGSAYVEGEISESTLRSALMKYGGKDKDEADTLVRVYSYKKAHPNTELSTVEIEAYTKEIPGYGKSLSASGISETAFLQYRKRADACEGTDKNGDGRTDSGSKKAQILAVIDSLPISAQQKDALYYANKWSSRELRKAPWH